MWTFLTHPVMQTFYWTGLPAIVVGLILYIGLLFYWNTPVRTYHRLYNQYRNAGYTDGNANYMAKQEIERIRRAERMLLK